MDRKTTEYLESKLEAAVADVLLEIGARRLPLLPSRRTMHLMAKAAVSVYEAAVEQVGQDSPQA